MPVECLFSIRGLLERIHDQPNYKNYLSFVIPKSNQSQPSEFRGQCSQDTSNTAVRMRDTNRTNVNKGNIEPQSLEGCRPCASSPVSTSIEMFHPENNESKTAGAFNNLAKGPEPDIPVETEDISVVISYPNFELKDFLIL